MIILDENIIFHYFFLWVGIQKASLVPRLPRLTAKGSLVILLRFPGTGSEVITLISCDLINYNKYGG